MKQTERDIAQTRAFTPPTEFYILTDTTGCVRGSAHPSGISFLTEDMEPGWTIDRVSRDEWERRAEPCLLDKCEHHGGAS